MKVYLINKNLCKKMLIEYLKYFPLLCKDFLTELVVLLCAVSC